MHTWHLERPVVESPYVNLNTGDSDGPGRSAF